MGSHIAIRKSITVNFRMVGYVNGKWSNSQMASWHHCLSSCLPALHIYGPMLLQLLSMTLQIPEIRDSQVDRSPSRSWGIASLCLPIGPHNCHTACRFCFTYFATLRKIAVICYDLMPFAFRILPLGQPFWNRLYGEYVYVCVVDCTAKVCTVCTSGVQLTSERAQVMHCS